ncbi:unnamed protein product [Ceutorhynchus assimilis]|uniref:Uncharacterized protein n=1 Tax=Ceutorhynchus assimilis TaxID=467358 RepID=A0A9N9MXM4_9CUCU|nr:unnamed protein product [Ceutorhynchus assimilis]
MSFKNRTKLIINEAKKQYTGIEQGTRPIQKKIEIIESGNALKEINENKTKEDYIEAENRKDTEISYVIENFNEDELKDSPDPNILDESNIVVDNATENRTTQSSASSCSTNEGKEQYTGIEQGTTPIEKKIEIIESENAVKEINENKTKEDYIEAENLKDSEISYVIENFNEDELKDSPNPNILDESNIVVDNETENRTAQSSASSSSTSSPSSSRSSSSSSSSSSSRSSSSRNSSSSPSIESEPYGSDDSVQDPTYNTSSDSDTENREPLEIQVKKKRKIKDPCTKERIGKKRKVDPKIWQKNLAKKLRNSGEGYVSLGLVKNQDGSKHVVKKQRPPRRLLPPCGNKCKLKCSEKLLEDKRAKIFKDYWELGDIEKQREFISSNMKTVAPKYKYSNAENPRQPNNAYYFVVDDKNIRVCKFFFMATLSINNRVIQTVIMKQKHCESGKVVASDKRGKHGNHHKVDEEIKNGIRHHIKSIPRVESHYCRSHSKKEYIEGNKTMADLHRDYKKLCVDQNTAAGNYIIYCKIFNEEFNITFHLPKKDQCEICLQYKIGNEEEKQGLTEKYERHIMEKDLSRLEKEGDKNGDDYKSNSV